MESGWECRNCYLTNAHTNSKCGECSAEKPEAVQPDLSSNETSAFFLCEANEDNAQEKLRTQTPHKHSGWECRNCYLTNAHTNSKCGECSAEKPEAVQPDLSSNETSASFPCETNEDNEQEKLRTQTPHTHSGWECRNCYLTNAHTNSKCGECSAEKPEAAHPDLSSNGTSASFPCETNEDNEQEKLRTQTPHTHRNCNLTNAHTNSKCGECSAEKPEAAQPDLSSNEQSAFFLCEANEDNEQEKLRTQTPHKHSGWECRNCYLTNAHTNSKCGECSAEKPEAAHPDLSSNETSASFPCETNEDNEQEKLRTQNPSHTQRPFLARPMKKNEQEKLKTLTPYTHSGWKCSICSLTNAHTKSKCEACNAEKPEDAQPELSSNEQSDWSCQMCTFVNKSTDDICAICNSPQKSDTDGPDDGQAFLNKGAKLLPQNLDIEKTEELRIVIIGKTGTGKSSTGNTILGKKEFKSKVWAASVTSKCKLGINKRFGRKIVLVDTPGLFDTGITNEQLTKEIVKCIAMTAPGPHAILLTVNIGRFTKEEQDTVKHFVDHFGVGMYHYLMVVFTRADDLENEVDIDVYVKGGPQPLKAILHLCNNRYIPFNNKLTGADQEHQVKSLISLIDDVVQRNGGCCYTNEMYQEAEESFRRREEEIIRKLKEEERQHIESIRLQLQAEFKKEFAKAKQAQDQLASEMRECENKRQREKDRYYELMNKITDYKHKLHYCRQEGPNRNMELEGQLVHLIKSLEKSLLEQKKSANESTDNICIAQMQKQLEEIESRQKNEMEHLKRENERREKEIREEYQQKQNSSVLRDDARRECEQETGVMSRIWNGITGAAGRVKRSVSEGCSIM